MNYKEHIRVYDKFNYGTKKELKLYRTYQMYGTLLNDLYELNNYRYFILSALEKAIHQETRCHHQHHHLTDQTL